MKFNRASRHNEPCNTFKSVLQGSLCLFCFIIPAFAQQDITFTSDNIIGVDVSLQIATIRKSNRLNQGIIGIGGRAGYYLGSVIFLDGEIFHEPEKLVEGYSKKTSVLGGFRFGSIIDDELGVFVKVRAGALMLKADDYNLQPNENNNIHPVVDLGIILERYFQRNFFLRLDIGDYIVPFGNTKTLSIYGDHYRLGTTHNLALEFGLGFRF